MWNGFAVVLSLCELIKDMSKIWPRIGPKLIIPGHVVFGWISYTLFIILVILSFFLYFSQHIKKQINAKRHNFSHISSLLPLFQSRSLTHWLLSAR